MHKLCTRFQSTYIWPAGHVGKRQVVSHSRYCASLKRALVREAWLSKSVDPWRCCRYVKSHRRLLPESLPNNTCADCWAFVGTAVDRSSWLEGAYIVGSWRKDTEEDDQTVHGRCRENAMVFIELLVSVDSAGKGYLLQKSEELYFGVDQINMQITMHAHTCYCLANQWWSINAINDACKDIRIVISVHIGMVPVSRNDVLRTYVMCDAHIYFYTLTLCRQWGSAS